MERYLSAMWALETDFHNSVLAIATKRLSAGKEALYIPSKDKAARPSTMPISGKINGLNVAGNVRVLPIDGAMSRSGDLCSHGTEQISAWIKEANDDASVSSIVLKINSPGGDVDGTEQLADTVRASKKPVVAYVAGMAASAAYWVASAAREIIMESATTSYVGSIGVLAAHVNATKALAEAGYEVTIIRADGSEDKALFNDVEPLTEQVLSETKARLTSVRSTFVAAVKGGRMNVQEGVFSGKMYDGNEAVKNKLADRVGNFDAALGRAMFHARKEELSKNKNNEKAMSYMKLEALLGGALPEGMQEETAVALEAALGQRDERITTLEAEVGTATARIDALVVAETELKAYQDTNLTAGQVSVLNAWYESAKSVNATGGNADDANNQPPVKKMSAATAQAKAVYDQLHGKK